MAPGPRTPRTISSTRQRARQSETATATSNTATTLRRARTSSIVVTEPPPKRRRYHPGGSGGGGRFSNKNAEALVDETTAATTGRPRTRTGIPPPNNTDSPSIFPPRRERSTRIRTATRINQDDEMQISSAAAVAAAVVQSEGYKPREERGWEEFHPNLDIEATFRLFHANEVDGIAQSIPETPSGRAMIGNTNDVGSSFKEQPRVSSLNTPNVPPNGVMFTSQSVVATTPTRRRGGRQSLYATRGDGALPPNTPTPLPIHGQNNKEKLDLKQPSYRKTNRILIFESKTFGQARYVDKAMMNMGYQESDNYIRPDRRLIKATDGIIEEDHDISAVPRVDGEISHQSTNNLGRVEYDMDEQDDMWLEAYNSNRKSQGWNAITREVFEITITKIEKEWHGLEKRIPKPNPKPPQTHRPRSSSAAAVNGEPQQGEEQDSKCAICDDGDCENTNAIVFCDGCDLAVHQECYGVPYIPEGQWLCRKCQLIGRGIPTCIFCPNSDGAFKQTQNSSKWAHLLCAMWIPEVTLANNTFLEPVSDVDKVPKGRWKLTCYICNQQMGACIQCGNKSCYQAFHVTCARRARLYLHMKTSSGGLEVHEANPNMMALCDKHCPADHAKKNDVVQATKRAKKFYKKTMRDRLWASNQASAMALAATHRDAITDHAPDESQVTGAKLSAVLGDKRGQQGKSIWKLPSGAPVIPQAVFDIVEASIQRFNFLKRKEFVSDACRYWTLKREMRRGAALLKRLQLQMEAFSSMELTRRDFVAMGSVGKSRLARRIEFAEMLVKDLEKLKSLSQDIVDREQCKLNSAELERDFVDTCYFPIHKLLPPVIEKAIMLDRDLFYDGLLAISSRVEQRYYTTTLTFAHDLCEVIHNGINTEPNRPAEASPNPALGPPMPARVESFSDPRERKKLGKRILKAVQPHLEMALRLESDANHRPFDGLKQQLEAMIERGIEYSPKPVGQGGDGEVEQSEDVIIAVRGLNHGGITIGDGNSDVEMTDDNNQASVDGNIEVDTSAMEAGTKAESAQTTPVVVAVSSFEAMGTKSDEPATNGIQPVNTPPETNGTNGYVSVPSTSQPAPPTPPQSNGSLGRQPIDALTDGGILWYLKEYELEGTSAAEIEWDIQNDVDSVSEELSEIDDEELKELGVRVSGESITASPAAAIPIVDVAHHPSPTKKTPRAKRRNKTTYRRR